jgi:hypothetical protein
MNSLSSVLINVASHYPFIVRMRENIHSLIIHENEPPSFSEALACFLAKCTKEELEGHLPEFCSFIYECLRLAPSNELRAIRKVAHHSVYIGNIKLPEKLTLYFNQREANMSPFFFINNQLTDEFYVHRFLISQGTPAEIHINRYLCSHLANFLAGPFCDAAQSILMEVIYISTIYIIFQFDLFQPQDSAHLLRYRLRDFSPKGKVAELQLYVRPVHR